MKLLHFLLCLQLFVDSQAFAQRNKSLLLTNATIHVGNGTIINNGSIGISKTGKVELVNNAAVNSGFDSVIDLKNKHVYPGFISPDNILGLTEIDAVRATRDFNEIGAMNPHIRAGIAFNTDSKIIPTVRSNGVLITEATPSGGVISGTSSVMALDGWNWEDAAIKMDIGIHLHFPKTHTQTITGDDESGPWEKNKNYEKQRTELKKFFEDAKAYLATETSEEKNIRFEAMRGMFSGQKILFLHADFVKDITEAVLFAEQYQLQRIVIVGGRESWLITDFLKEHRVSVIVNRTHSLPEYAYEDIDAPAKLPALLQKAGILFCLGNAGDMQAPNTRNLPFQAGTAAAYGLTKEEAVAAITGNTAKILGIDNMCGTLEPGKDATIIVSEGDALDMRTNNITLALVKGRIVNLINDQQVLYEKYKKKYGLK